MFVWILILGMALCSFAGLVLAILATADEEPARATLADRTVF